MRLARHSVAHGALHRPAFLASLGLLIINDHFLKTAGLLPGGLTGKLSDFAGLVVAPLTLCALFGAARGVKRLTCFAAPALVFIAINLSTRAAGWMEHVTMAIGLPWSITTDPTDLIAFAVYPFAYRMRGGVTRRAEDRADDHASTRTKPRGPLRTLTESRWSARFLTALSAAACLATSVQGPAAWQASAVVVNDTSEPLDLRVRPFEGAADCKLLENQAPRALTRASFGPGVSISLDPGTTLPLDSAGFGNATGTSWSMAADCVLTLIQIDGMPDVVVFDADPQLRTVAFSREMRERTVPDDIAVQIVRGDRAALEAVHEGSLTVFPLEPQVAPSSCALEAASFSWTNPPEETAPMRDSDGASTLTGIAVGIDGCTRLDLRGNTAADDGANPVWSLYLCIPREAVPFEVGQRIHVTASSRSTSYERYIRVFASNATGAPRSELLIWSGFDDGRAPFGATFVADACGGHRTPCGGYATPGSIVFERFGIDTGADSPDEASADNAASSPAQTMQSAFGLTPPTLHGEPSPYEWPLSTPASVRAVLGKAEHPILQPIACGGRRSVLPRMSFALIRKAIP